MRSRLGSLALALMLIGCGESGAPGSGGVGAASSPPVPIGDSVITGRVLFEGKAPAPVPLRLDAEPVCKAQHPAGLASETLVAAGPNGTLRNVFVHIQTGLVGAAFRPPDSPVSLDQRGCQYVPHVFGIQVGQAVRLVNSDSVLHNVHARPSNGKGFNVGMPGRSQPWSIEKSFTAAEIVPIRCDVHPWMVSWAAVSDHPFFSVTGKDGAFALRGLPAGTYTVQAWHETLGTRTQKVSVGAHASKSLTFTFKATP